MKSGVMGRSNNIPGGGCSTEDRKSVVSGNSSTASTLVADSLASSSTKTGSSSQLRKFTAGVGRPGLAREAREAVRNVLVAQNPMRKPPLAEPVDYEKFIHDRSIQLENDPQRDLVLFPRDDIQESFNAQEPETDVPMITDTDIMNAKWLLTREALRFYTSPKRSIVFNYAKFSGDYTMNNGSSSLESETLSSLVFESDMAIEEERAAYQGGLFAAVGVIKEGFMMVVKSDPTLFDNLKAAKKRFCVLKKMEGGDITIEVRKTALEASKRPPLVVVAAQIKSTKKGKTVLEIEAASNDDKNKSTASASDKSLMLTSEDQTQLEDWLVAIQAAVSFANKEDATSICSEMEKKQTDGTSTTTSAGRTTAPDSVSIGSEDSGQSRDVQPWRGRNTAARALQPPIVERRNIFSVFYRLQPLPHLKYDNSTLVQDRKRSDPASPNMRASTTRKIKINDYPNGPCRVLVDFKALMLRLPVMSGIMQQVEPMFVRLFIFDVQEGRRVTEEFQLLVNGDDLQVSAPVFDESIQVNGVQRSLLVDRTANRALISLVNSNANHWLVCRVDRALSADTTGDLYMKSSGDSKATAKMQKAIASSITRLAGYRQRFAWTARPLFPDLRGEANNPQNNPPAWAKGGEPLQLYRCEQNRMTDLDLQRQLTDFSKMEKANKMTIPNAAVSILLNTNVAITDFPCQVNPSLYPLKPWKKAEEKMVPPVFHLQVFGDKPSEPHSTLKNLLYIYPLSLKYDNQKVFSKARNIACTIRFVRGDEAIPEKAVIDRLSPSGPYTIQTTCSVQHHQQYPTFGDEIKTQLPLNLTGHDHLLFSFSHISVAGNASVKTPEATETSIGYAWLPLIWKKDRLVLEQEEQEFALPVAVDLPSHYFKNKPTVAGKGDENLEMRWVDQKPLFRVRLRLVSSAFTTNGKLQSFFQACSRLSSRGIIGDATDSVRRLPKSKSNSPADMTDQSQMRSCSPIVEMSFKRSPSCYDDSHLNEKIRVLQEVPFENLMVYLPVVLGRLFDILPKAPTDLMALGTLKSIVWICDLCCKHEKEHLIRRYVKYFFHPSDLDSRRGGASGEESVHAVICKYLPVLLREYQNQTEELSVIYRQLWLLIDVAMKSIAQTICAEQLNKTAQKDRFPADLLEQMGQVLETAVPQIVAKHREIPEESRCANVALAEFIRFSLSFVDRGVVFKWLHFFVSKLDDSDFRALREYKADLLMVVCSHEHFLQLNLPVLINAQNHIQRVNLSAGVTEPQPTTSASGASFLSRFFNQIFNTPTMEVTETDRYGQCKGDWRLSAHYATNHFLTGLLLQELVACLREPKDYRKRPICLLRNLLAKHSLDSRYNELTIQRRIALLYAPILHFVLEHLHEIEPAVSEDVDVTPTGYRCIPQNNGKWQSLTRNYDSTDMSISRATPLRASEEKYGSKNLPPPPPPPTTLPIPSTPTRAASPQQTPLTEKLDDDELQDILVCALFVVQKLPRRILAAMWAEQEGAHAEKLLRLLEVILDVFRYKGKEHALRRTAANSKTRGFKLEPPVARTPSNVSSLPRNSVDRTDFASWDDAETPTTVPFRVLQLVNLSQEVALIVLDAAQTMAHQLAGQLNRWSNGEALFLRILSIHLQLVDDRWSESVRLHAIAALALFVNLFRARLFEGGPLEALYSLIEKVLLQMASRLQNVQLAAAALLQLILRNGYEVAEGYFASQAMAYSVSPSTSANKQTRRTATSERLGRPGAQTGVALARLLGFQSVLSNSVHFERGLAGLENLVDTRKATSFDKAVLDLLRQLRGVMSATVALKDAANDSMRLAALHLQLADSYRGSAALRSAWFDTLAEIYEQDRWFAEASVCHAHSVAIIGRELEEKGELEIDWRVFDWVNSEIASAENCRKDGSVQPAGFTADNLASKIDKTASALTLAERFEAVGPLYRLIVPLLERNMNFSTLVSIYAELQQTYSRAAEVRSSSKRHLGAYFRVRFYGETHFENDHNTDWIYREIGLTSLAAFALHMKETVQKMLGHEKVQIEANDLDLAKIDESVAYVQVTHVEPTFDEGKRPKSDFWQHTNISEFFYECAMMENVKADQEKIGKEPSISEQILNRTVVTVNGVFPSSRRRLPVVSVKSQKFSPLEFACQKLLVKAHQIRKTLAASESGRQLDLKGLQLLLQGAVMPTVNAGPLAYAEAFTKEEQVARYGEQGIVELKHAFRSLMSACQSAIQANEAAIGPDQQTYHEVLVSSFEAMHERLQSFFGESLRQSTEPEKALMLPRSAMHILDSIGGVRP